MGESFDDVDSVLRVLERPALAKVPPERVRAVIRPKSGPSSHCPLIVGESNQHQGIVEARPDDLSQPLRVGDFLLILKILAFCLLYHYLIY